MLSYSYVNHPEEILDLIKKKDKKFFSPDQTTWVVSDLKSKLDIQNLYLDEFSYYSDDSILRISDFWSLLLHRMAPQFNVVSKEFMRLLVKSYVEDNYEFLGIEKSDYLTLYDYMSVLAPLILHKESHENLKEWIKSKEQTEHNIIWLQWELCAKLCLDHIVHNYKYLEKSWVVSVLLIQDLEYFYWPKKILVDLNSQMSSLEMGVLKTLSKLNDVEILVPNPNWKNLYPHLLNTYNDNLGYAQFTHLLSQSQINVINPKPQYIRFNSELNEIKFITAQIRRWIDQGVSLNKIAIISPRLEDFWSILKFHLDQEGCIYQKEQVSPMMSLGIIQTWLAQILIQTDQMKWIHLEQAYPLIQKKFINNSSIINFEKYKSFLSEIIDPSEISIIDELKDYFYNQININEKVNRNHFLMILLKSWITIESLNTYQLNNDYIKIIIQDFIKQTEKSDSILLIIEDWFALLSQRLSQLEVKIQEINQDGILIIPLNSAHVIQADYKIWFGLDESGLKAIQNSFLSQEEISELKKIFDLAIDYPEESHAEFNLRWFSQCKVKEQFFTTSLLSLNSDPLNSSLFFLENSNAFNEENELISDEKNFKLSENNVNVLDHKINNFKDQITQSPYFYKYEQDLASRAIVTNNIKIDSLTPSDLESYSQCSFKLLAKNGFQTRQLDSFGFDIKPRQKGQIIHDLFNFIISHKEKFEVSQTDLIVFLDEYRLKNFLFNKADPFWIPVRNKLLTLAQKFCDFESKRLSQIKDIKHMSEQKLEIFYDFEQKSFVVDRPHHKAISLKGRFDRFDYINQFGILYDYKSSKSDSIHYASDWIKNTEFQLMFYTEAIEKIWSINVQASNYYFYKNFDHHYGFCLTDDSTEEQKNLISCLKLKKKSYLDEDSKKYLFQDFNSTIDKILTNIESRHFIVQPLDKKYCELCDWKLTCRINHHQ